MSIYLHDIPLEQAWEHFRSALEAGGLWGVLGCETIPLTENALGRTLGEPVWARISSPHYHASAMDGFAVHSMETIGAIPSSPKILKIGSQARYLDTGDPIPTSFDAVIPIEDVESLDGDQVLSEDARKPALIRVRAAVAPWSHIRPVGEDIVVSQMALPAGKVLRPADLGAVAAAGHDRVTVSGKPRVAVLPTGSELVSIGSELKAGDILEYNSLVLAAQLVDWGAVPRKYPITPDSLEAICAALQAAALDNDLVLLNAGSSAGAEDYSAQAISRLGRVLVHGVAVRPGHPVILGMLDGPRPVPVLGVPGYPVSAALTAELFVQPLLAVWQGRQPPSRPRVPASLTRKVVSPAGDDDYVRVILGNVGDRLLAAPLPRGAGVITSLSKADGLVVFPRGVQGAEAGQLVEVETLIDTSLFSRTIFCVGSHDMTLDLLAQYLTGKGLRLVSSNVGSLGGLLALKKGEAHLAGCHLMDPETGIYNIAYIHKYLPGIPVMVYGFLDRKQGLMVAGGNPLGIARLEDLVRGDVRFANRQRGAGTRILLDHHLDRLGLPAESIRGYNQEEYTHLGVAVAVASGRADCGLGIPAAAESLGLDFIPLFEETYQLVIPKDLAEGAFLQPLLAILHDQQFQSVVASMPGYGISRMGDLMAEVNDDTGFDYR